MAADQIELRTTTFTKGHGWLDSYGTLLRDNDILLGRGRWTTGETVLAQADCQPGAWQIQPGDRILRHWRVDGTAEADDEDRFLLSTPIRGDWHWLDSEASPGVRGAFPPLDNRVVRGDSILVDTEVAGSESYVLHYGSAEGRFWGRGVLCEARTLATSGVPDQSSSRIILRSSRWDTSGTPAEQPRDWSFQAGTSASAGDSYSFLKVQRRSNLGSWSDAALLDSNGFLVLYGGLPGVQFNSGGVGRAFVRIDSGDPDLSRIEFGHGGSSKLARFRFAGSTDERSGAAALALSAIYGSAATGGATTVKSASSGWVASYWDGAVGVEAAAYAQHVLTGTDPAGYLRHGFGYGVGTSDHYSDGAVLLTMDREGASAYGGALTIAPHEVSGPSTADFIHSPYYSALAYSGVAGGARSIAWNAQIDSDADADDRWSLRFVAVGGGPASDVVGFRHTGEQLVADTATAVAVYGLAAGTHPAVASGTTKTTPGGVDAWETVDVNGTTYYRPLYTSKTA